MSYVILGRTIKNEYLTLGTLFTVGAAVFTLKGGKKESSSTINKPLTERVQEAVPIKAQSSEEEELMDSIRKFIAEAEKEGGGSSHH